MPRLRYGNYTVEQIGVLSLLCVTVCVCTVTAVHYRVPRFYDQKLLWSVCSRLTDTVTESQQQYDHSSAVPVYQSLLCTTIKMVKDSQCDSVIPVTLKYLVLSQRLYFAICFSSSILIIMEMVYRLVVSFKFIM